MKAKTHKFNYISGLFIALCICINTVQAKEKLLRCTAADQNNHKILKSILQKYGKANIYEEIRYLSWLYGPYTSSLENNAQFKTLNLPAASTLYMTDDSVRRGITTNVFYNKKSNELSTSGSQMDTWIVYQVSSNWRLEIIQSSSSSSEKSSITNINLSCNPDYKQFEDDEDEDEDEENKCAMPYDSNKQVKDVQEMLDSDSEAEEPEENPQPPKDKKPVWAYSCKVDKQAQETHIGNIIKSYGITTISSPFEITWVSDRDDNPKHLYFGVKTLSDKGSLNKELFATRAAFINTFDVSYSRPSKLSYVGGRACRKLRDKWEFSFIEKNTWKLDITRDAHDYGITDNLSLMLTCNPTKNEEKPTVTLHMPPTAEIKTNGK